MMLLLVTSQAPVQELYYRGRPSKKPDAPGDYTQGAYLLAKGPSNEGPKKPGREKNRKKLPIPLASDSYREPSALEVVAGNFQLSAIFFEVPHTPGDFF